MSKVQRKHPDIDGGWAWIILMTSFMTLLLVCGALYSVSVFNVIFLDVFQASKTATSLVGSVLIGLIAFMGPVSSAMSNRYGWRFPIMLGGIIASLGTFLASFAQNMTQLTIFYGIVSGIGHGLCYTPAIVVVGYYFETYRTLASGFASVGAGVGMMLFPPLIRYLRLACTWRELFVYISCMYAQICVLGALMRPLPKRSEDDFIVDIDPGIADKEKKDVGKKRKSSDEFSTEEECAVTDDLLQHKNENSVKTWKDNISLYSMKALNGSTVEVRDRNEFQIFEPRINNNEIQHNGSFGLNTNHRIKMKELTPDTISIVSTLNNPNCKCSKVGLYFGTCCTYSCACSKLSSSNKIRKAKNSLHFYINASFSVFLLSIFMFGLGLSALYVHLSAFGISHGASETESSFMVTILGISSIISRVITGIAGNDPSIDNTILYIGAFGISGMITMVCPLIASTYKGRMVFTILFGFYGSCFNVLLAPLTVEIIGLNHLSTAFGIEMVVNGVAYFLGPPLAGLLYDVTNSYDTSFFLAGTCLMLSSIVMMFVSVGGKTTEESKSTAKTLVRYSLDNLKTTDLTPDIISSEERSE